MIKFVAYYRVSTQQQGESGLGLEGQQANNEAHIKSVGGELIESYTDVASGKSIEGRPNLEKAIQLCEENGYTLIVAKADRLARNTGEALNIYKRLNEKFVSCDCPETNELMLTMLFAFATQERKLIAQRTKSALESLRAREELKEGHEKTRKGKVKMNGRAKGCNTSEATKASILARKTLADKQASKVFHLASDLRNGGDSLQAVADKLNRYGHTTPKGKSWNPVAVSRVLKRNLG